MLPIFPHRLSKADVHGHYCTNQNTGAKVWVDSYEDRRTTKTGKMVFARWNHRKEHVRANLAVPPRSRG